MKGQLDNQQNKDWRILDESVLGASHEKTGKPNQDAISLSSTSDAVILAIADGHGSEKYFRSDIGSDYAVRIAVAEVEHLLNQIPLKEKDLKDADYAHIKQQLGELPRSIVARWRKEVELHLEKIPFFTKEEWKYFNNGKTLPEIKNHIIPYGATLLVTLVTEKFIFCLQLGDGDIVFVRENTQIVKPMEDDKRLLANETTSLCTDTAEKDFRQKFLRLVSAPPALIMLSTDGYANSFNTTQGFLQVGKDILKMLRAEGGLEEVRGNMRKWLDNATNQGSGDDITVGIICHLSALKPPFPAAEPSAKEVSKQNAVPQLPQQEVTSQPPPHQLSPSSNLPAAPVNIDRTSPNPGVDPTVRRAPLDDQAILAAQPAKDVRPPSPQFKPPTGPLQYQEQKLEAGVPPIVVSQSGNGNYTTITDALQHAIPGSVIDVYPGTYQEALDINKSVALIARGQGEVIIESLVPCLTIIAQETHMEGFKIRGLSRREVSKERVAAIEVMEGDVKFLNCDITSDSRRGVLVRGTGNKISLYDCHIHDTKGEGIVFRDITTGTLEKCTIYGNETIGIGISGSANVTLAGIKPNKSAESTSASSKISVIRCEVNNNGKGGIIVQVQSVAEIINSLVQGNSSFGIYMLGSSQVTVRGTMISNNIGAGIFVDDSILTAKESKVVSNKANGITLRREGVAQMEGCFIHGNDSVGIRIIEKSHATIQGTEIYDSTDTGIFVENSTITAISSQVMNNKSGIVIQDQGSAQLTDSSLQMNKDFGIMVTKDGEATIQGGNISTEGDKAVVIFTHGSKGEMRECTITSPNDSVVAREHTRISLDHCTVDTQSNCFYAEKKSIITVINCFARGSKRIYKDKTSEINISNSK